MKRTIHLLSLSFCILAIHFIGCSSNSSSSVVMAESEEEDCLEDTIAVEEIDSVALAAKIDSLDSAAAEPVTEEKVEKQIEEVMEEPEEVMNEETGLKAKDLIIEEDYDVASLEAAFNQLTPSLDRKAQKAVMNTIQVDFSDSRMKGVVKGKFLGDARNDYSIRSYMNRLTMVGPYNIKVKDLKRDDSGKIISITLEELENLNL